MDPTEPPKPPRRRKPPISETPAAPGAPVRRRASPASDAAAAPPVQRRAAKNSAADTAAASTPPRPRASAAPAASSAAVDAAAKKPRAPRRTAAAPLTADASPRSIAAPVARATPAARPPAAADRVPSFARAPSAPPARATTAHPADSSARSTRVIDALIARLPVGWRNRAREYLVLTRMDRPVGALLLLWPTWWALWFAAHDFPPPGLLLIFTLGVFVMRSAGCVINDYADHGWLDAHVERTAGRPMAAGRVSKKEALALFGGLLALAFVLVLFTNALTIKLSLVGAALAAIYPFTKRYTHLAQVVLGAAFGWSIPMAFAAVTDSLPPLCWLLFLANVLFSTLYDTQYAMVDRDEDLRVGAKSTAILFGDADRAILGVLMATFLLAMLLAGTRSALHWPYYLGLATAAGLFVHQQWLIRARARDACFAAFRNNNWVGLALWVGLVLALAIR